MMEHKIMDFEDIVVIIGAIALFVIAVVLFLLPFVVASWIAVTFFSLTGVIYWAFVIVVGCLINGFLGLLNRAFKD